MALAHPDSAPWFVSLFHQYSLTIEQWRRLSDGKSSHISQLQELLEQLEAGNQELRSKLSKQSKVIAELEYELECQRQSASAFCNAPVPAESLHHRETQDSGNCYLCSPSRLMLNESSPPIAAVSFGDEVCEEGEERTTKRRRTNDGE